MFAHIPKCAGVSVYSSFLSSGWEIKNLRVNIRPDSAFSILKARFGIENVEQHGRLFGYPHTPQHAVHLIWRTWGPFEASFAIVREPKARLLSALQYHYRTKKGLSFELFSESNLKQALSRPWAPYFMLDGHLIPQHCFIAPDTEIFRFEDNWASEISNRFDVKLPPHDNQAQKNTHILSKEWEETAQRVYRKDFVRFMY